MYIYEAICSYIYLCIYKFVCVFVCECVRARVRLYVNTSEHICIYMKLYVAYSRARLRQFALKKSAKYTVSEQT